MLTRQIRNGGILLVFFALCGCQSTPTTQSVPDSPTEEVVTAAVPSPAPSAISTVNPRMDSTQKVASEKEEQPVRAVPTANTKKERKRAEEKTTNEASLERPKKHVRKAPAIKFAETVHQFGTIQSGEKVKHEFKFENVGDAPLVIKNVEVSCGCTFPSYPFLPIEPGDEGVIEVTFDSTHKVGRQKPVVTITTNTRPSTHKLYMEGVVN